MLPLGGTQSFLELRGATLSLGWDWNLGPPDPQPDALTSALSSRGTRNTRVTEPKLNY